MRAQEFLTEQADMPTRAYHITGLENAEEIMYKGLDPHDGKAFLIVDTGDQRKLHDEIYQVTGWLEAKAHNPDEEMTLLQVDITDLPLEYEYGWHFSTNRIPPDRIKDLGSDALRKYV